MRTFSSSLMAILIIAALFWGNCYSCPQVLLAQQHRCCHQKNAPSVSCATQNLQHFVKAGPCPVAPPVASAAPEPNPSAWAPASESPTVIAVPRVPELLSLRV
jgi:hypothetical protein